MKSVQALKINQTHEMNKQHIFNSILGNLLSASFGSTCSWGAPNFLLLTSNSTPFDSGPVSKEHASFVVSLPTFGAIFGTLVYSLIIDRVSRKTLLISIAIPQIVHYFNIFFFGYFIQSFVLDLSLFVLVELDGKVVSDKYLSFVYFAGDSRFCWKWIVYCLSRVRF